MTAPIDDAALARQEAIFAQVFAAGDVRGARSLYDPGVVYVSPTLRLFDRKAPIEGLDATLEFIQLTLTGCERIRYEAVERACLDRGAGAFTRILFDFDFQGERRRSDYVVLYHYREGRITHQQLYYDPSGAFDRVAPPEAP